MIEYRSQKASTTNDTYSGIIREASEYFAAQRVHMIGNGFEEILSEQSLFDTYVDKLSKGLTADEAAQMEQLLENTKTHILRESSVSGIQPISALSMPTVRKMWVKVALKNAVPTEPVKAPKFAISYMEPYLVGADGIKHPIPKVLRDPAGANHATLKKLAATPITLPATAYDLFTGITASVANGETVDPKFFVKSVVLTVGAGTETVNVRKELDLRNNIVFDVQSADGSVKDTVFCTVDRAKASLNAVSLSGNVKSIVVDGKVTQESNIAGESVSFDIKSKDVTIGTGTHLNAPLPIEWLQDSMAMYQVDGALEVVDLMSNVFAQKLDLEILDFVDRSYENAGANYNATFDLKPRASFAGSPKEWREELKTVFDFLAQKMKNDSAFSGGTFVLIGNPLDMNLITNVDWVFNSNTDERGGVEVDFNLGAYSGAQRYNLVASANVPAGVIRMIYVPSTPKQMTYKYYPYTFNVEKGYRDPNQPNVPSIMMTKRHAMEELIPMAAQITIENNGNFDVINA